MSVPVTVYVFPATVPVVNTTVATPFASVVLVEDAKEPPVPVLLHVTVFLLCPVVAGFPWPKRLAEMPRKG